MDFEGYKIKWVARYGKNGRKYVWTNLTLKKLANLLKKYGIDHCEKDGIWLN